MQTNISKEEALSLLQQAMIEPLGLLVYASDAQPFIQALYRARTSDPSLMSLQIRQTPEGIAICHEPHEGLPTDDETAEKDKDNDQTIY
jgi:hypothetical protein